MRRNQIKGICKTLMVHNKSQENDTRNVGFFYINQ